MRSLFFRRGAVLRSGSLRAGLTACVSLFLGTASRVAAAPSVHSGQATIPPAGQAGQAAAQSAGASLVPDMAFSWGGYFQALAIICFVLALIWAVLWVIRRKGFGPLARGQSVPSMRVESRLALAPKKWLVVVRYLDRRLVLGLTDKTITLISELPLEEERPAPVADAAQAKTGAQEVPPPLSFEELLGKDRNAPS